MAAATLMGQLTNHREYVHNAEAVRFLRAAGRVVDEVEREDAAQQ